jgi:hypothetical protein
VRKEAKRQEEIEEVAAGRMLYKRDGVVRAKEVNRIRCRASVSGRRPRLGAQQSVSADQLRAGSTASPSGKKRLVVPASAEHRQAFGAALPLLVRRECDKCPQTRNKEPSASVARPAGM